MGAGTTRPPPRGEGACQGNDHASRIEEQAPHCTQKWGECLLPDWRLWVGRALADGVGGPAKVTVCNQAPFSTSITVWVVSSSNVDIVRFGAHVCSTGRACDDAREMMQTTRLFVFSAFSTDRTPIL